VRPGEIPSTAVPVNTNGSADPTLETSLDEAAAAYKQLGAADVASMVANADRMLAALRAKDIGTARQAWIDTRRFYERSEVFIFMYPDLIASVDAWPMATQGFHAVETALFTPGSPLPLAEAEQLTEKLHLLQRIFTAQPLYAHELLMGIGTLAFTIGDSKALQDQSAASGTSLADLQQNVEGMELAWNKVLAPTIWAHDKGSAGRIETQLAAVKELVGAPSFDQIDTKALAKATQQLQDALADAAVSLRWRRPDFSDMD
jgi:iron uptake system EfeUOB component EfeO/EfeM